MSHPASTGTRLADEAGLDALIRAMARGIADGRRPDLPLALVGIRTRGVPIAERIAAELKALGAGPEALGAVDITLYRDDLDHTRRWPVLRGTDIPFPVDGAEIVLVDDVLYTGRTIRAALDAVCDLGRPGCVRLAALVDRGGREFPIQPDVVGMSAFVGPSEWLMVRLRPIDEVEEVVRLDARE